MDEQGVIAGERGMPGLVCYLMKDGEIIRKSSTEFGPGDAFCSLWHVLAMAGIGEAGWTPQYGYWKRPESTQMEDGGENLDCQC